MHQAQYKIQPNTTNLLLANFSLAIDEANLVKLITTAENEIARLQSCDGGLDQISILRDEIAFLEGRLRAVRKLVRR